MYQYIPPQNNPVPILLSIPHCGTLIPPHLGLQTTVCPDTDWFLRELYDFAPSLGIGVLYATYARYVVDLNRSPQSTPLYSDGRIITDAIPLQQFDGTPLYTTPPTPTEKSDRIKKYFQPYHGQLHARLQQLYKKFGIALLFDAHSIKRFVPTIHPLPFPDLILGSNDHRSARPAIIDHAWKWLNEAPFHTRHNTPFKGGYITRTYGQPDQGIHALQLEMSQDIYMNEEKQTWNSEKARPIADFLRDFLSHLITVVS